MKPWLCALLLCGAWRCEALEEAALQAAASYSRSQGGLVLLVAQNGRRILTATANGGSAGKSYKIYSGTKMFWALAGLGAEQDGWLNLEERVAETIPEWTADPLRAKVTIRQLLNFTSGLEPNFGLHGDGLANRNASALRTRLGATPGSTFIYGPAALQVFHEVLKRKLAARSQSPTRYLERRVLRPLGLGAQRYVADRAGNPLLAAGFKLQASQWLLLGECLLRQGAPIVPAGAFAAATRGTSANPAFSFALWNNQGAPGGREIDPEEMLERPWERQNWSNACLARNAPDDLLACIGSGGQRLYVVPSQNLVIVRQAQFSRFRDAEFLNRLFAK